MPTTRTLLIALAALAASGAPAAAQPDHGDWDAIPADCRPFLTRPGDTRSEVAWAQRLSLAACEEPRHAALTATSADQLQQVIADLDRQIQPSVALYRDAMARGPDQVRMLAAYGLGMAYLNVVVLARSAVAAPPDLLTNPDAADRYTALHESLEPMLNTFRVDAKAAFARADLMASGDPARVAANPVVHHAMVSAHAQRAELARR